MVLKLLDRLEEVIIATLMAAATLIIFVAVVHRYACGVPIIQDFILSWDFSWAQELCVFMFVWMAKFGAAYGVRTGIHVGVDVVIKQLSDRPYKALVAFGLLSGAAFTAIVGTLGVTFCYRLAQTEQITPDLEWPSWIIYLAIPLGSYLMCFRFLQVLVAFLRTGHLPAVDHAHVDGIEPVDGIDPIEAAREGGPS
ncbi:MAG: TRAP transporter small permease subunit [Azospirillum sp.]|nr:TRAP transporter small permease subunit [Azospirillum sp.]